MTYTGNWHRNANKLSPNSIKHVRKKNGSTGTAKNKKTTRTSGTDNVYEPTFRYFKLLSFTKDQEDVRQLLRNRKLW